MSFKINDTNYNLYKKVYEIIWLHKSALLDPHRVKIANPVEIMNRWEKKNKSLAKRGLSESLRDSISSLKEFPPDIIKAIEADLQKNNLPNIRTLQSLIYNTIKKVLKRGKIKNTEEYYTIKEMVIDQSSSITEEERILLDKYIEEYEFPTTGNGSQ